MKKLSVSNMHTIAQAFKGQDFDAVQVADNLDLPVNRVSNFVKAGDGDINTSPQYQVKFWNKFVEFDGNLEQLEAFFAIPEKAEKIDNRPISGGSMEPVTAKRSKLTGQKFVFTSAQNNTDVHEKFLNSILNYCKRENAQLVIGQFVYNKNGFQNGVQDESEIYFDHKLKPYFVTEPVEILNGYTWAGELNILPTAKYPLTGLSQYGGSLGVIVPHAKISMESVASPKAEQAKLLYATGAVTMHNYIQKRSGQLAENEHCYGALVVELGEHGGFFARQIETDESGIFQDLNTIYKPDGTIEEGEVLAVNWGDLHAEKSDSMQLEACHSILDELEPKAQFFHDCFDMTSRNHHNRESGHFLASMYANGETVRNDLENCANVLSDFYRDFSKCVIVESNHDLALESWLNCNKYDFRKDPQNALTYLELQTAQYNAIFNKQSDFNLLKYALTEWLPDQLELEDFEFLVTDQSYKIKDIEFGMHGHVGANGSRGNPKQFNKLSCKANTGHTHSASIYGGVYTAGVTGSLEMGYNIGFSSWSHSHILTYSTGFRTIITVNQDGQFRS